jgi:hypothetical protein
VPPGGINIYLSISSVKLKLFLDFTLPSRTHLGLITLGKVATVQAIVDDALTKAIKAVKVAVKTAPQTYHLLLDVQMDQSPQRLRDGFN